jgi:hypothetical protein
MHLLLVEFNWSFAIKKSDGSNMHQIIYECTRATTQYKNNPLKATDKFLMAKNFSASTLDKRILQ